MKASIPLANPEAKKIAFARLAAAGLRSTPHFTLADFELQ